MKNRYFAEGFIYGIGDEDEIYKIWDALDKMDTSFFTAKTMATIHLMKKEAKKLAAPYKRVDCDTHRTYLYWDKEEMLSEAETGEDSIFERDSFGDWVSMEY